MKLTEAERFERFETTDIALGPHCSCWTPAAAGGPFLKHPAGCLCICHPGRKAGG